MCADHVRGADRILIISADIVLAESRKAVIEGDGWIVAFSRNKQHALAMLYNEQFDLIILCSSLSSLSQLEFTAIFREENPKGRVISIVVRGMPDARFDATLMAPVSPPELLEAVRKILIGG